VTCGASASSRSRSCAVRACRFPRVTYAAAAAALCVACHSASAAIVDIARVLEVQGSRRSGVTPSARSTAASAAATTPSRVRRRVGRLPVAVAHHCHAPFGWAGVSPSCCGCAYPCRCCRPRLGDPLRGVQRLH